MKQELEVRVYRNKSDEGFLSMLFQGLLNIKNSNFLAFQLAKRDISAQYRQSLLGIVWSLITPISTAVLWLFLKGGGAVQLEEPGMNYALYVFIGTIAWSILTDSINGPIQSVKGMKGTLSKINFPKEALFISSIYKTLFNIGIKLLILVGMMIYFGQSIGIGIIYFPLVLGLIVFVSATFGLLITPLGLLFGDVSKMIGPIMQILMYLSPVVFVVAYSPDNFYSRVVHANPLSPLINNFRNSLLSQPLDQVNYLIWIFAISLILFSIALVVFRVTIPIITERISG